MLALLGRNQRLCPATSPSSPALLPRSDAPEVTTSASFLFSLSHSLPGPHLYYILPSFHNSARRIIVADFVLFSFQPSCEPTMSLLPPISHQI